jgi:hypothetical protein
LRATGTIAATGRPRPTSPSHTRESGLYEETPVGGGGAPKRTLTLYSNAFNTSAWHTAALGAPGKAVTGYGRTAWQEDYADSESAAKRAKPG